MAGKAEGRGKPSSKGTAQHASRLVSAKRRKASSSQQLPSGRHGATAGRFAAPSAPQHATAGEAGSSDSEAELPDLEPGTAYDALLGLLQSSAAPSDREQQQCSVQPAAASKHSTGQTNGSSANPTGTVDTLQIAQEQPVGGIDAAEQAAEGKDSESTAILESRAANGGVKAAKDAAPDYYSRHLDRELLEGEIAALSGAKVDFRVAEGAQQQGAYRSAQWVVHGTQLAEMPRRLAGYGVKERLQSRWRELHPAPPTDPPSTKAAAPATNSRPEKLGKGQQGAGKTGDAADADFVSGQQRALFSVCNSYADVIYPARPYPVSGQEADPLLDAVLLHCLNHCAKTADRIKRNNERLKAGEELDTPRDQGFTRAKVLILLPMRNFALRVVLRLVALAQKETRKDTVQNKERFLEEFGDTDAEGLTAEEAALMAKALQKKNAKPAEHEALFQGNCDDHFRLGIKITRGAVRLFSEFYESDIIVASPLGLATKLEEAAANDEEGGADFLSSVEVAVVDRADVMAMQNWQHILTVFGALNKLPEAQHGTDIMRVRDWYLSGWGAHYRQTILLCSWANAEMNALFNRTCANHAGKAKLKPICKGVLTAVQPQVRLLFERFSPPAAADAAEARFQHFCRHLWPRIKEAASTGQLIFVPSYFDFVRLRNFLTAEAASFVGLCEYTKRADVPRGRSNFFHGRRSLLLYTERCHFYNRFSLRGVKDILFYQLPEHAHYVAEVVNMLQQPGEPADAAAHATVQALFCRLDTLQLERVVGSARSKKMLQSEKASFAFDYST